MTTLVVGATGATGSLLVGQLLDRGVKVKAIVRSPDRLPAAVQSHPGLSVVRAAVLSLSDAELAAHVSECDAVASCLGHRVSFKGMYGPPRRLVTDAARRLCQALRARERERPAKFVLMNTAGNRNRDLNEQVSFAQRVVLVLLRALVPPHADNEDAAEVLHTEIGQNDRAVEWAAVRPDTLIDEEAVSEYEVHPSPTRSAIFNAGATSRINVAHFMAQLITDDATWRAWRGQMPVIYNVPIVES